MPNRLTPGVYIEEAAGRPRAIQAVRTSTAGFAGETERGPISPQLVTSWNEFQRLYGGYVDQYPFAASNASLPYAVRGFFDNGGQRLFVARVVSSGATVARRVLVGTSGATTVCAIGPGTWGNEIVIAVKAATLRQPGTATADWFRIQLLYYRERPAVFVDPTDVTQRANPNRREPDLFEDFDNLSHDAAESNFARVVINGASKLIEVESCLGAPPQVAFTAPVRLENGGPEPYVVPSDNDFIGSSSGAANERTGIEALCAIDEVSLMAVPSDALPHVQDALMDRCETLRDRFAIVDLDGSTDLANMRPPRDTSFAAVYYPQLLVHAPHVATEYRYVPAAGHVAGVIARVDTQRGVHKAPANEVVRGIVSRDLADGRTPLKYTVTRYEHDVLNPRGVNVIRDFRSAHRDIRVWGARTMSSDPEWKYVNVRRFVMMLEQSIKDGTQWTVFEPNGLATWNAVRMSVESFLGVQWRSGALAGSREREAFFVRCDRTTMTQHDIDSGVLICEVGVALLRPAEFVIIRISQKTAA